MNLENICKRLGNYIKKGITTTAFATYMMLTPFTAAQEDSIPKKDYSLCDFVQTYNKFEVPEIEAKGEIVKVDSISSFSNALRNLKDNTTIILESGVYRLDNTKRIENRRNVSLMGATNNPEDVVLIGKGMDSKNHGGVGHGLMLLGVNDFLIANLTIKDVYWHSLQIYPDCDNIHVYNCNFIDAGQQFIKVNAPKGPNEDGVDNGIIEYCKIQYTDYAKGTYTNGIDIHRGKNWSIKNNLFRNIRAKKGLAGPAILVWNYSKDIITEENLFIECQRGIHYGMSSKKKKDNEGGIIKNNLFYRKGRGDVGIALWNSPETKVYNNTIILNGTYSNSIEYRFQGTFNYDIQYNLTDEVILNRGAGKGNLFKNIVNANSNLFVDPKNLDFRFRNR